MRRIDWQLPAGTPVDFEPRNIPVMFWREAWEAVFKQDLGTRRELPVRTFLSAALMRCAFGVDWQRACHELGLDEDAADRFREYGALLTSPDHLGNELFDRLAAVAAAVSRTPHLIDYRVRATALPDVRLALDEWREICASSGMHPGRGSRQLNADMWLFAEITGRPLEHSGAWTRRQQQATEQQISAGHSQLWKDYRFYRRELPELRPALLEMAQELADTIDGTDTAGVPAARLLRGILTTDFA